MSTKPRKTIAAAAKAAPAKSPAERAPLAQQAWIRFMAPVNAPTSTALMQTIDQTMANGARELHLMISSPGGTVFHGLSIHNYLRGLDVPVFTYNFGSVDSIGVVIFCAGDTRICVPHARFLIHPVSVTFNGQATLDAKGLEEHLKSVNIDSQNIARVIADSSARSLLEVEKDMSDRTTLNPTQAKDYGLVTRVQKDLFRGGHLHSIYETGQVFQSSVGIQQLAHSTVTQMHYSSPSAGRNSTIPLSLANDEHDAAAVVRSFFIPPRAPLG